MRGSGSHPPTVTPIVTHKGHLHRSCLHRFLYRRARRSVGAGAFALRARYRLKELNILPLSPFLVSPNCPVSTTPVSTAFSTFGEARRWNRGVPGTGERGPCFIPICFTGGTCSTPICSTRAAVTGRPLTNVDFVAALSRAREEAENLTKPDIVASRTRTRGFGFNIFQQVRDQDWSTRGTSIPPLVRLCWAPIPVGQRFGGLK